MSVLDPNDDLIGASDQQGRIHYCEECGAWAPLSVDVDSKSSTPQLTGRWYCARHYPDFPPPLEGNNQWFTEEAKQAFHESVRRCTGR